MKKISLVFVLLLGVILISACSGGSDKAKSEGAKKEYKITWRDTGASDTMKVYLEKTFVPEFEKANPDMKIVLSPIQASEGDYFSKVALAMQSESTAPDVVAEDSFMLNSDANAGYLLALDKYVEKWDDWDKYIESLKKGSIAEDGKLYAIPATSDTRGLWYNKEVFKKAGLPADWQPKNWQEIIEAAETIKAKVPDVIPFAANVAKANGESVSMQTFEMLLYGTEDTLYDEESKKWIVSSQGIEDSLSFIDEVFNQKKLTPSLSMVMNSNYGSVMFQDKLPKGELGIILDGHWNIGNYTKEGVVPLDDPEAILGFAAMPTQNGQGAGQTTMVGGWTWAIPAKAKDHDASWKIVKALGDKENQAERAIVSGNLTARGDSAELSAYKDRPIIPAATAFLEYGHFRPASDKYPNVSTEIQNAVEGVASGALTPKKAAEAYKNNVSRIVGKENTSEE